MTLAHITPHLSQIQCPDDLRQIKGWLLWRYEQKEGEKKPRKVPYYAGGGHRGAHGTVDDRQRLTTFDAAIAAAARKGFDGVGLAMLADWGLVALDFDNVTPDVMPEVEALVGGTYAEFSPSGGGVRAFVKGTSPSRKNFDPPYGFETFHNSGYVTFTGNRLPIVDMLGSENTIADMTLEIRELIETRFKKQRTAGDRPVQTGERVGYTDEQIAAMLKAVEPDESYQQWVEVGMAIHHETDGEGFDLWDEWSSNGGLYQGRDETQRKWDSFGRQSGAGVTLRRLMKLAKEQGATLGGPVASPDDFEVVTGDDETGEKGPARLKFEVVPAAEFAKRPAPRWIVKGIIPQADLVVVFGESGSGKSFIVTDLALSIARGVDWRGHKTRQGRVVYIAAEGGGGYRNRLRAYAHHHQADLAGIPFGIIHAAPNFLQKEDVKAVAKAIELAEGAEIIVVDTFAQVTPGANENAGEDMGLALKHARMIGDATGALVILVHHSGKDASKGARGWSGIRAAADAELEVIRTPTGRFLRTTKQKDGDDGGEWGFTLNTVTVDIDEDGQPIDSCVVLEAGVPVHGKGDKVKKRKAGPWEEAVMTAIVELSLGGGMVRLADVIEKAISLRPEVDLPMFTRRGNAKRAIEKLKRAGEIGMVDDVIFEVED